MRKKPYPIQQLTGGLNVSVDPVFLADTASPNLKNVYFDKGLVKKDYSIPTFGSGLPLAGGSVMNIDNFVLYDGTIFTLVFTKTKAYYIKSDLSYGDLSGAFSWTGTLDNQFTGVASFDSTGADQYIVTNGKDNIKKWSGNVGSSFTDLLGWSAGNVQAKSLANFASRLVAGYTIESGNYCPRRVRWSASGNIEDITSTGSGFVDLVDTPDKVVALVPFKGNLFVFKERSIWNLQYVGGNQIFLPVPVIDGIGSFSVNGISKMPETIGFYDDNDIYTFDAISTPQSLGIQIRDMLFKSNASVNNALANRSCSTYRTDLESFVFSMVPIGGTIPSIMLMYDTVYGSWLQRIRECTALGYYQSLPGVTWSSLANTWSAATKIWMDQTLPAAVPFMLIGDSLGNIYQDDRVTQDTSYACYETKDFVFEHSARWAELRMQLKGLQAGSCDVSYSIDSGASWSMVRRYNLQSDWTDYTFPLNKTCQRMRFRIETYANDFQIKWIEPWYIPRKRELKTNFS